LRAEPDVTTPIEVYDSILPPPRFWLRIAYRDEMPVRLTKALSYAATTEYFKVGIAFFFLEEEHGFV